MSKPLIYACGMNKSTAKRLGIYLFGAFFNEIIVDEKERMFHFSIHESIEIPKENTDEYETIFFKERFPETYRKHFLEYWGKEVPGFTLKLVNLTIEMKNLD